MSLHGYPVDKSIFLLTYIAVITGIGLANDYVAEPAIPSVIESHLLFTTTCAAPGGSTF